MSVPPVTFPADTPKKTPNKFHWEPSDIVTGRVIVQADKPRGDRYLLSYRYIESGGTMFTGVALTDGNTSDLGSSLLAAAASLNAADWCPAEVFDFICMRSIGRGKTHA